MVFCFFLYMGVSMSKRVLLATLLAGVFFSGCVDSDCDGGNCTENYGVNPDLVVSKAPLTAYCTVAVKGVGTVDMETDYIPNVTWCENGGAADEALKTQTVAARSYVYWKIKNNETVPVNKTLATFTAKANATMYIFGVGTIPNNRDGKAIVVSSFGVD